MAWPGLARWMLVILTAPLLLSLAPTGAAQAPPLAKWSMEIAVQPAPDPIAPITERGTAIATITVTCEANSVWVDPAPLMLEVAVNASDERAVATWGPASHALVFETQECLAGSEKSVAVDVEIVFAPGFPASGQATFTVNARVTEIGLEEEASWTQQADMYFNHQARFERAIWKTGPGMGIQVPLTMANQGNGEVKFSFTMAENSAKMLAVALPPEQVVPSGGTRTVLVDVMTPESDDYVNRRDTLILDVTAVWALDPEVAGEAVQLTAVVQTQGSGTLEELPGTFLGPLVAVGLALALVARRRA